MRLFKMPIFIFTLVISVALLNGISSAQTMEEDHIVANSNIVAATVYSNRAKVTRKAVVSLKAGSQKVVFKDLPTILYPDSLRAEGSAKANVVFGAVSHKRVNSADLTQPREKELNEELQKLQDQITLMSTDKQALSAKQTFIQSIGKTAQLRENEEIAKMDLNVGQWSGAADTIFTELSSIYKAQRELDFKIRDLNKEVQRVRNELSQIRTGQKSVIEVAIPLETDKATELTIELSYQVPNATWSPLYDARLETDSGSDLSLIQYGSVRQTTGEDWTDVALTLSTAQPHRGSSLPHLQPYWVNIWDPSVAAKRSRMLMKESAPRGMGANMMAMDALEMEEDGFAGTAELAAAPMPKEARFQAAQIETGGFVSEYKIPGPSDVKSDGTETKLMVGAFETESDLQIHIKPQISGEAFVVSHALLKGEAPILPGKVSLFRDGAYIGQAYFPMLRPGDDHDLFFGVDDQVTVKRNVLKDEKKDAGIIARGNNIEKQFVTEIKNLHKDALKIVVQETIPVGQNEKIEVEVSKEATTQGYKSDVDDKKGLLEWTFDLGAKDTKKINLGWKISWPKDHNITGLR